MPHGFNSDADAIGELFRRMDHVEAQLKVHADNVERSHGAVKDQVEEARSAAQELRDLLKTQRSAQRE